MGITISKLLPSGFEATYARPISSASLRLDTGHLELTVALYKDAEARFSGAEPAGYDRVMLQLTDEERAALLDVIYSAMDRLGTYPDGEPRDPDPEKEAEEQPEEEETNGSN